MDRMRFFAVSLAFGVEHNEWLVGWIAGLAFGWIYWKTRDIWSACIAHIFANLALGWYVIHFGMWRYW